MANIGQSVRLAHVIGILCIASLCFYTLCVKSEHVESGGNQPPGQSSNGALTIVETTEDADGEDDGLVSDDNSGEVEEEETIESVEDFIPTEEWKNVKKGQKIPPGLHVRMDFETGQRQAKLMEGNEKVKAQQWDGGDKIGVINTQQKMRFSKDELKKALEDFKYKDIDSQNNKEKEEKVRQQFRSYGELKKAMEDIQLAEKTEIEIVSELLDRLRKEDKELVETVTILTDLEYYLHQIDNAQIFSDNGGLLTLKSLMNNTSDDIREMSAFVLGSALQSNAKVQIAAVEVGLMQQLLKMLSVDPSLSVRKKAMYAMSALIRQFPHAQKHFLGLGGLSALADLFKSSKQDGMKIKIITLLTDLLVEYDHNIGQENSEDSNQVQRTLQYREIKLRESLSSTGWCSLMTSMVHSSPDHDSLEKVIHAMSALVSTCKQDFSPARAHLQGLLASYQHLAQEEREEDQDDFFSSIHFSLLQLISKLPKDEL